MTLRCNLPLRATLKLIITVSIVLIILYRHTSQNSSLSLHLSSVRLLHKHYLQFEKKRTLNKSSKRKSLKRLSLKKIDWHNYTLIENESRRTGIGEHGVAASLEDQDKAEIKRLIKTEGFNTALSDKIPLNRSLPDLRHPGCKKRLYIESLPTVSIIIIFHNEHWTTLLRTVVSVLNRSPEKLIKEIFLVDDASHKDFFKKNLDDYIDKHWPKVKVVRLSSRSGVVGARLAGAKLATADVLIFLDSHIEVNVNWLPPLLEPIALDSNTAAVALIDNIDFRNFKYHKIDDGARSFFDYTSFDYVRLEILPQDAAKLPEPFETPSMSGGAFAISRRFFWKLGGYDSGLKLWGGEQIELSLKIWQCGGRLLEVPCSRVGHLKNVQHHIRYLSDGVLSKNIRRVADVWMDEFATVYAGMTYIGVRKNDYPGDLSKQKALRRRLQCKPFRWFISHVAFDVLQQLLPFMYEQSYAEGRISPKSKPHLCIEGKISQHSASVVIKGCKKDRKLQKFIFSWHHDIQFRKWDPVKADFHVLCITVKNLTIGGHITSEKCHRHGGNQLWRYYEETKQFVSLNNLCLDHDPLKLKLFVSTCDNGSETQKWTIDGVGIENLKEWNPSNTVWVTGPVESWDEN